MQDLGVTLSGLELIHGVSNADDEDDSGGGIYAWNNYAINVRRSVIKQNVGISNPNTTPYDSGGGVYLSGGVTL